MEWEFKLILLIYAVMFLTWGFLAAIEKIGKWIVEESGDEDERDY